MFLLNVARLRLVMLHFAMFVLRCFPNHLGWFAIDPVLSIDYIEELMKVCAVSNTRAVNR